MLKAIVFKAVIAVAALLPPAAALAQQQIDITDRDCQRILMHVPSADVAYKPGVDVRGRKVKGADLGGASPIEVPDEITFNVGSDMANKHLGGDYTGDTVFGKVTVMKGRVYWNGKPLDNSNQSAIAEACKRNYKKE